MKLDLKKLKACQEGRDYYNSKPDFETAWDECPRGDWMLWTACKLDVDNGLIARTAIECAGTVRHLMNDPRSINALDKAIEFLDGKISIEDLTIARNEARDAAAEAARAARAAAADADADAVAVAVAVAYAADAAYVASYSAAAAAYSAYAAAAAAAAVASAASAADADADAVAVAKKNNELQTADICQEYLTEAVSEKVKKLNKKA